MNVVQKIKEFRVQEMDSSHVEKQYILSYNDRNFAINHNTKLLIDIVQDSEGPDELVENFCEVLHRDLSFDELELKLSEKFEAILHVLFQVYPLRLDRVFYRLDIVHRVCIVFLDANVHLAFRSKHTSLVSAGTLQYFLR